MLFTITNCTNREPPYLLKNDKSLMNIDIFDRFLGMGKLTFSGLIFIVAGLAFLAVSSLSGKPASKIDTTKTVLYFGNTCPHCKDLAKYIEENKIKEKVNFEEKEVYGNAKNSKELVEVAKSCNLGMETVGVPFLFANGKCFIGIDEAKNYLRSKAGLL